MKFRLGGVDVVVELSVSGEVKKYRGMKCCYSLSVLFSSASKRCVDAVGNGEEIKTHFILLVTKSWSLTIALVSKSCAVWVVLQ